MYIRIALQARTGCVHAPAEPDGLIEMLDKTDGVALYIQIRDTLREQIMTGVLKPGKSSRLRTTSLPASG